MQQSQDRLLDGQSLLNQREEYVFNRSQELTRLEKQLEASKLDVENERKVLFEKKQDLDLLQTSLSAREEVCCQSFLINSVLLNGFVNILFFQFYVPTGCYQQGV